MYSTPNHEPLQALAFAFSLQRFGASTYGVDAEGPAIDLNLRGGYTDNRVDELQQFFSALYGGIPSGNFGYVVNFKGKTLRGVELGKSPEAFRELAKAAIELSDKGLDCWHNVNPINVMPTFAKRGSEDAVSYQSAVICDIDISGAAHKDSNLASSFDEAKSFLPFAPSIVVDSGYGLHAYYIWQSPIKITDDNRAEVKARNERLLAAIRAKAGGKKIDSVGDLPRILRTPCTRNYKLGRDGAPICRVVEINDARYSLAEFDKLLDDCAAKSGNIFSAAAEKIPPAQMKFGEDPAFDGFRVRRMIDCIDIKNLPYDDWLPAMTALRSLDYTPAELDALNVGGRNYDRGRNERILAGVKTWTPDEAIGTLCNIAKLYGYDAREVYHEYKSSRADFHSDEKIARNKGKTPFDVYKFLRGDLDDLGMSRRLVKYRGDAVRWLTDEEIWLICADGIWQRQSDKPSCLLPMATQFHDDMQDGLKILKAEADRTKNVQEAAAKEIFGVDEIDQKSLKSQEAKLSEADLQRWEKAKGDAEKSAKFADIADKVVRILKHRSYVTAAIEFMKGEKSILITNGDLNRHKNLFAVKNGVIDLESGKKFSADPKFLITNQANAFFNPRVDTSFVKKFLSDILPDEQTRSAVLRYLAYSLTGEKTFHISQFWRGSGANGKSTLLDAVIALLGTYGTKLPPKAFIESPRPADANAASPAIAALDGDIRLAVLDEIPRKCRLDAALFKTITGDATTTARNLYSNLRTIELRAKLILNGNHLPQFDVDDSAILRRINTVEFTQKFSGDRADPDLPKKLSTPENRSALLKLLVDEAQDFYHNGLLESSDMQKAKAAYLNENDFVAEFITENVISKQGAEISRKDFEERLKTAYPRAARFSRKELLDMICARLEPLGGAYAKDGHNRNIFRNVAFADIPKES